jgi:menaquinone-dependent protoporphyrinogen oxidase
MSILVAYATQYGSTQGIAERLAARLKGEGLEVELQPIAAVGDISRYEAFVIGSAAYIGSWLKEATRFARRNHNVLATRPVWLFSSGPIGTATKDEKGRDVLLAAEPKEFAEFAASIRPRGYRVFFGALDRKKLKGAHRLMAMLPASKEWLIEGDFRDWDRIEAWADEIAHDLARVPAVSR